MTFPGIKTLKNLTPSRLIERTMNAAANLPARWERARAEADWEHQQALAAEIGAYGNRWDATQGGKLRETPRDELTNTENPHVWTERRQLINLCRALEENAPPVSGAINVLADHLIPLGGWRSTYPDRRIANLLTTAVNRRLGKEQFHYGGRSDAITTFGQSFRDSNTDGDIAWEYVPEDGGRRNLVNPVRAHRIGDPTKFNLEFDFDLADPASGQPETFMHIDGLNVRRRNNKVVSYEIYEQRLLDGAFFRQAVVPAERISFLGHFKHTDSFRGVPPWHASAATIQDWKDIWGLQKQGLKTAAGITALIERERGKVRGTDPNVLLRPTVDGQKLTATYRLEPGTIKYLNPGEKVAQFVQQNPNAQFWDFMKWMLECGAWSINMPFAFLYMADDMGAGPLRFTLSKASRALKHLRQDSLAMSLDEVVSIAVTEMIVFTGELRQLNPLMIDEYIKGEWCFDKDLTADDARQGKLLLEETRFGAMSMTQLCAFLGFKFDQVMTDKKSELLFIIQLAREVSLEHPDLPFSWIVDRLSTILPNGDPRSTEQEEKGGEESERTVPSNPSKRRTDRSGRPVPSNAARAIAEMAA